MIIIPRLLINQMGQHAIADYPNECCGILVGTIAAEKRVQNCYKTANKNQGRAHDRYQISAMELYQIDRRARENNLNLIGFYHSHPDSPPYPSVYDTQTAWPVYSYLIIAVDKTKTATVKSWVLDSHKQCFLAEELSQV
jgi:proteasome lid subunit RPN8/RPN11